MMRRRGIRAFALSYLGKPGVAETRRSEFVRHAVLAPIWEELLYLLLMLPSFATIFLWWNLWGHAASLTNFVYQGTIIILNGWLATRIMVILHIPGNFSTEYKRLTVRRLARRIETAWVWEDRPRARQHAAQLLPLCEEVWALSDDEFSHFWQAVCHYVLATDPRLNNVQVLELQEKAVDIAQASTYALNSVVEPDQLGMDSERPMAPIMGLTDAVVERRGGRWQAEFAILIKASVEQIYSLLFDVPRLFRACDLLLEPVPMSSGDPNLPRWRVRFAPRMYLHYTTDLAQPPIRLSRITEAFGLRVNAHYELIRQPNGTSIVVLRLEILRIHFPRRLPQYLNSQIAMLHSIKAFIESDQDGNRLASPRASGV